jgi:hypothetical protein
VLADCARAGCAAVRDAARQKHTGEIILANVDIDSSRLFLQVISAGYFCRVFLRIAFCFNGRAR